MGPQHMTGHSTDCACQISTLSRFAVALLRNVVRHFSSQAGKNV